MGSTNAINIREIIRFAFGAVVVRRTAVESIPNWREGEYDHVFDYFNEGERRECELR
jgi:hypothetical protein